MIPATDAGEAYDQGVEFGRAQRGGEVVRGLTIRAEAAERDAATADTARKRAMNADVAKWLRGLAAEARRGEL